jgi:hypothetical protein
MLKIGRVSGAVALIMTLSMSAPAWAHPDFEWYDVTGPADERFPWDAAGDTIYALSSGSTWPSGWKNAIELSDGRWDNLLPADLFKANTLEEPFPGELCSNDFNGQQIIRRGQTPMNDMALTVKCLNSAGQWGRWYITIDSSFTWYSGTGDAPAGQQHLRGVMVHEFGHATGWGSGTEASHFADTDAACPSLAADRATMCGKWGTIYQSVQHLMSTLEPHDTHTFLNVY